MARWRVDFVRHDILHTRFLVFVARFFLSDQEFHFSKTTDVTFLCPDVVGVTVDCSRDCVDALAERIDTDSLTTIADACVAFDG